MPGARAAEGPPTRTAARRLGVRVPVLHERGVGATLARVSLNVAVFVLLAGGVVALDVWFSRLVRNTPLRHQSGVELVLQGFVGVSFLAIVALPPWLVVMEWVARKLPEPRAVAFVASLALGAAGPGLYGDLAGWEGARRFLPLGLTALYGVLVLLPDGREEARTLSLHRAATALALAVLAIAGYALASYREGGIEHPRRFEIDLGELRAIEIQRAGTGAPGPLFTDEGSAEARSALPLGSIAGLIPAELPGQLFQSEGCRPHVTVLIVVGEDNVTYGPCRLPRAIERLRYRLIDVWKRHMAPGGPAPGSR